MAKKVDSKPKEEKNEMKDEKKDEMVVEKKTQNIIVYSKSKTFLANFLKSVNYRKL